jgi:hypothetical protein
MKDPLEFVLVALWFLLIMAVFVALPTFVIVHFVLKYW